jgi:hypothetical protein
LASGWRRERWQRIVAVERARLSRSRSGNASRPIGADPLTVVDYLYLAQLPPILFGTAVWEQAREHLSDARDAKQRLQTAVHQIAPVRNEIAHVREVDRDRLLRATVACADVLELLVPSRAQ